MECVIANDTSRFAAAARLHVVDEKKQCGVAVARGPDLATKEMVDFQLTGIEQENATGKQGAAKKDITNKQQEHHLQRRHSPVLLVNNDKREIEAEEEHG